MGTNCPPVVAEGFLFCYEMGFMMSFADDKQADIIYIQIFGWYFNHK